MNNVDVKETIVDVRRWKKWGLTHNPFELHPNDKLFLTAESEEYLDLLPQFARFCNTLLVICGEAGIGKTALLQQFVQSQMVDTRVLSIRAEECPTLTALLQLLNQHYHAPYDPNSAESDTAKLDLQIQYLLEHRESRLLVIDDAEKLSLSMRQACLQIVQQQSVINTCLPVILAGLPVIVEQMNALLTPTTAQECLHILRMEAFDRKQTEEYCRFVWQQAGGERQEFPFNEDELEQIYSNSRGVLRDINIIAPALLGQRKDTTSLTFLKSKLMWWIFALVSIFIALFFYRTFIQQTDNTLTVITKPNTDSLVLTHSASDAPAVTADATNSASPSSSAGDAVTTPSATSPALTTPTSAAPSDKANDVQAMSHEESASEAAPNDAATANANEESSINQAAAGAEVAPPAAPVPVVSAPAIKKKVATSNTQSATLVMASKQDHLFKNVMNQRIRAYHERVRKLKPTDYTLQLMASENLKTVQAFILKYQLQETTMILRTNNKGKAWYVVVFGVFHDQALAKNAVKNLPPVLAKSKPWARSYEGLQRILLDKE